MPRRAPAAGRPWQATLIVIIVFLAVAGAAGAGWWYARESPPHQGPIVLISVDGLNRNHLAAYDESAAGIPSIDALAADGIVFERAYTHSPLQLPAHASLLAGQLPFEHGVRDEAGFALADEARPLAELLRSRGFDTGAAVSSFLLRPESGVAQGFQFFDADLPEPDGTTHPVIARDGEQTAEVAGRWLRAQRGQRFFLFMQVDHESADAAVGRIVQDLKDRRLYDDATILLTADRGEASDGLSLDEEALRVPLIVKQPGSEGAGRRVEVPVQHVDLVPTVLDLVRAPIPSGLSGRSLRAVLDKDNGSIAEQPIYSESLAARLRVGDQPLFAVTTRDFQLIRGAEDELVALEPAPADSPAAPADEAGSTRLREWLDRLAGAASTPRPAEIAPADEDQYAALGYLNGATITASLTDDELTALPQPALRALVDSHREAAQLAGQKRYAAAIERLRAISRAHPSLAVVQYQLGRLLTRSGRLDEAVAAFRTAAAQLPDQPYLRLALARALARTNRLDEAARVADMGIALAERRDPLLLAAAHEVAARIALQRSDADAALAHAEAAAAADPGLPLPQFVRGTLRFLEGQYEEALAALLDADAVARDHRRPFEGLQLAIGNTLVELDRADEAEARFREELEAFPRSLQARIALASLYQQGGREAEVEAVIADVLEAVPTPEGYGAAARLWMMAGDRARADAIRADARARFRGDPSLALLGR